MTARGFAVLVADEAPTPDRPWLSCLTCSEAVEDFPPAVSGHRRRHQARPLLRRSPLLTAKERQVRADVFARDGFRCQLRGVPGAGDCHGPLTYHHRRKAGQGGKYTLANGATLCRHHNQLLESRADVAAIGEALGLVLRRRPRAHTCSTIDCAACLDELESSTALSHPSVKMGRVS